MVDDGLAEPLLRWIPLWPLLAAVVHGVLLGVLRRPLARGGVAMISGGAALLSLLCTCLAFANLIDREETGASLLDIAYTWIGAGIGSSAFSADMSFQLDPLSAVMALLVTGIGFTIQVYAVGYMSQDERDDRGFQRFFAYFNLFVAAMLVLVLADNLLLMFLGWVGVTLCTYLMIGFWYGDPESAYAGSKAFIANCIGDAAFLVGIMLLFWSLSDVGSPTISFRGIEAAFGEIAQRTLTLPGAEGRELLLVDVLGLCFFVAACGKGAQLPLHVWLPSGTAGPAPALALIQTATTVTAGVYLMCRLSFLFAVAPAASAAIAWTGGLTALFAALCALGQRDINKLLAYSTMSQLGIMFLAIGCGAYAAAMFHVVTHSFFKTLLLLSAGAIVLALRNQSDLFRMGALRKRLPKMRVLMLVGVWAMASGPPLAGFFSHGQVLGVAFAAELPGHRALYWMGLFTALLTSFYAFRMQFLVFSGESHVEREVRAHLREPDNLMLVPLYALAVLSVLGGIAGMPQFWGDMIGIDDSDSLGNFVQLVVVAGARGVSTGTGWGLVFAGVAAWALGALGAWGLYVRNPALAERASESVASLAALLRNGFYVDALYDRMLVAPLLALSDRVLNRGIDAGLIDGLAVNGTARAIRALANDVFKLPHSGMTQGYLVVMITGMLGILLYLVR